MSSCHAQVAVEGPRKMCVEVPSSPGPVSEVVPGGRTTRDLVVTLIFFLVDLF